MSASTTLAPGLLARRSGRSGAHVVAAPLLEFVERFIAGRSVFVLGVALPAAQARAWAGVSWGGPIADLLASGEPLASGGVPLGWEPVECHARCNVQLGPATPCRKEVAAQIELRLTEDGLVPDQSPRRQRRHPRQGDRSVGRVPARHTAPNRRDPSASSSTTPARSRSRPRSSSHPICSTAAPVSPSSSLPTSRGDRPRSSVHCRLPLSTQPWKTSTCAGARRHHAAWSRRGAPGWRPRAG